MRAEPFIHSFSQQPDRSGAGVWNAIFGLRLEFCPRENLLAGFEAERFLEQRLAEHADFISMLSRQPEPTTFSLRYYCPNREEETSLSGNVEIALLGKVTRSSTEEAKDAAARLAGEVLSLLSAVFPNHRWSTISNQVDFDQIWCPFDWSSASIAEIRRREEKLQPMYSGPADSELEDGGEVHSAFVVNPFVGRPTTLARLLRVLLQQSAPVLFQATIAPVTLAETEKEALIEEIQKCERAEQIVIREVGSVFEHTTTAETRRMQSRAAGTALTQRLIRLQATPCLLNVSVASSAPLPRTLIEAIGVEITKPISADEQSFDHITGRLYRGGFDVALPGSEAEILSAQQNAELLQFRPWGKVWRPWVCGG